MRQLYHNVFGFSTLKLPELKDLYAGSEGQGIMLHTASHELVHFIRQWSAEKYKILSDFLMEQYGKKGISVDELVHRQIEKATASGRNIDYAEAHEEVIADSMERMLTDGKVLEKIQMLQAKDKSLFEKIKSWISDLVEKIKKAYKNVRPETTEGEIIAGMLDEIETIQQLFVDAIADATENFENAEVDTSKNVEQSDIRYYNRYWYPDMSLQDLSFVRTIAKNELVKTDNYIDNNTKWLYNKRNKPYFAIYSTENTEEPTILYACKDNQAKKEYEWFMTRRGYYESGTQLRATGGNIDEMLGIYGGSAFKSSMYRGNVGNGSGKSRNDTVYKGKSRFKPSQALLNCLDNIEEVPGERGKLKFSDRDPNALTPRNLLANALEESAVHEVEKKKLAEYKANIEKLYAKEQELYEVRKEIKELSFAPGKRDTTKLKKLQEKATKLSNNVTFYDKKLLNLESTSFLKNVLEREKSKAIKKQKEKDAEILKKQKEKALQKER